MQRRIFGPKRDEVTGGWRNNDKHQDAYKVSVGKREGKIPFGRFRHRWENNIKMGFKEIGWESVYWVWFGIGTGGGIL
jgi:hypothetical protein